MADSILDAVTALAAGDGPDSSRPSTQSYYGVFEQVEERPPPHWCAVQRGVRVACSVSGFHGLHQPWDSVPRRRVDAGVVRPVSSGGFGFSSATQHCLGGRNSARESCQGRRFGMPEWTWRLSRGFRPRFPTGPCIPGTTCRPDPGARLRRSCDSCVEPAVVTASREGRYLAEPTDAVARESRPRMRPVAPRPWVGVPRGWRSEVPALAAGLLNPTGLQG